MGEILALAGNLSPVAILAVVILLMVREVLARRKDGAPSSSSARGVNVEVGGGNGGSPGSDVLLLLGRTVAIQEGQAKMMERMDTRVTALEDIQRRCVSSRAGDPQ